MWRGRLPYAIELAGKLKASRSSLRYICARSRLHCWCCTKSLPQLLKTTLMNRKERWKRFQSLITSRARTQFFYLLSERGFRGKLLVSHKQKEIELKVDTLCARGRIASLTDIEGRTRRNSKKWQWPLDAWPFRRRKIIFYYLSPVIHLGGYGRTYPMLG